MALRRVEWLAQATGDRHHLMISIGVARSGNLVRQWVPIRIAVHTAGNAHLAERRVEKDDLVKIGLLKDQEVRVCPSNGRGYSDTGLEESDL